ncbi:MAG: hypothetical protein O9290_03685 [Microcystis sp. LE19-41.2A]|nr:hypothetical protein [Microcystis sp. LE19-41.2A]MCZ8045791.1 hypothetical protein [Microcystis sp. LE19-41.2A]
MQKAALFSQLRRSQLPSPHTPHPTPCPQEKLFQHTLNSNQ